MIRVAAVGDIHLGADNAGLLRPRLAPLAEQADVLLLAGDLTRHGTPDEGRLVAKEFADMPVPVVAVLGNHDYHSDAQDEIGRILSDAGMIVLECSSTVLSCNSGTLGVAGSKGFGGGFAGKNVSAFGEREIKAFVWHTQQIAEGLRAELASLDTDYRIALTHYSPVKDTLAGEPPEIYPFLGSYLLAEAVDATGTDLAVHGHAHAGTEKGATPAGVRVRNVALPVLNRAYAVYCLNHKDRTATEACDVQQRSLT
jgi:Icc-related predicted phosphoesterase